ncbi:MAG TPA: hypothetical protein VFP12_16145 [Allosphingosinicella sp.]|nr:hypothetical protein [Allosphingosinicella sp.]
MPVSPAFLFKHVRPFDMDGVETYFSDPWRTYVTGALGISNAVVATVAKAWTTTATTNPDLNQAPFITTATVVTDARGQELYRVRNSTILYMNGDQLGLLSNSNAGPNKSFVVDFSGDPIEIAVTIDDNGRATVNRKVKGIKVATDAAGNIDHFAGLTT